MGFCSPLDMLNMAYGTERYGLLQMQEMLLNGA